MREIRRDAIVLHPADRMYELIERVEDYPQFLPWCLATELIERSESVVRATVEVGVRDLRVRVTTHNEKRAPEFMAINLQGGSFRHFHGEWNLRPLGADGCHIVFMLRFELAMRAETLAGRLIEHAADRMVDAFVQRADFLAATSPVTAETSSATSTGSSGMR